MRFTKFADFFELRTLAAARKLARNTNSNAGEL